MAELEATPCEAIFDAFENVNIAFDNLASNYSITADIVLFINPIPRHRIAESDWVKLEKVFDGGTKVVSSIRPNYDEQSNRWKVSVTMSSTLEGPGTFRLIYTTGQGLVLATSRLFTITESVSCLELPLEDEANSQESLMSSFVTVSDQDEETFAAVDTATTDPSENSKLNEWEDLGVLQFGNTEGVTSRHKPPSPSHQTSSHQPPSPSHQTSSHQPPSPSCQTSAATVAEIIPATNLDQFQSTHRELKKELSDFTYDLTAVGEKDKAISACSNDEEKSEQKELEQASVSHNSEQSSHAVSSIHHTSSPSDPVATTTSGSCLGVPSLSQSVVLVDYISQAEAKAALRNNKEMGLKITKLTKKITSERQLYQQLRDQLQSCEKENLHLKERLTCVQEEVDQLKMRLSNSDHKVIDKEDIIKKVEADKQRYQQLSRDLRTKLDSYKVELHRLNQATKTYQTQLKVLQTENTVLRQRSVTGSNVLHFSSSPPRAHSPPKQHMVTGMTAVPNLRVTSHFPSHRQRERHQAEPHSSKVQPGVNSGLGTEHGYQASFGIKSSDMLSSQHERDKEGELRRTLMGDKDALIECPICNLTVPAHDNQHAMALHVEACLKDKGYQ